MAAETRADLPLLGQLPDGWGVVKFGDLLDGPTRNGVYKPKKFHGTGTKMINMGELFAFSRIEQPKMKRVQLSTTELDRFAVQAGDLLFARRSLVAEGAGKCSLVLGDGEPRAFESSIIRARPDKGKAVPVFLYYLFSSTYGRYLMSSILRQVAVSGIASSDLVNLEVPLPPLNEQQAIASILGSLDDKIELNRRMNETLEALARALFKSWFVDFDPVRAKMEGREPFGMDNETAALFPDSFEDSPLGEIPKGWRAGIFGEVAKHPQRTIKPENIEPSQAYIGLDHMPRKSIALREWDSAEGLGSNKYEFRIGEILFGKLRPYFHKVGVAPLDGVCSTDILIVAPDEPEWFGFVLGHISSTEFVDYTNASSTGTRMPRTNWKDMSSFEFVIPSVEVARLFTDLVRPFTDRIIANIHQSNNLAAIRDTLLPKLLSGEVRVGEAERIVEERVGGRRTSPAER